MRKREKEQTLPRVAPRTLALRDFVSKEKQDRIPVPKLEKRTKPDEHFPAPVPPHTHKNKANTVKLLFRNSARETTDSELEPSSRTSGDDDFPQ